jgi:hypothetical protein
VGDRCELSLDQNVTTLYDLRLFKDNWQASERQTMPLWKRPSTTPVLYELCDLDHSTFCFLHSRDTTRFSVCMPINSPMYTVHHRFKLLRDCFYHGIGFETPASSSTLHNCRADGTSTFSKNMEYFKPTRLHMPVIAGILRFSTMSSTAANSRCG